LPPTAVLERVERLEREGLAGAVEDSMANGYAPELHHDQARFAAFRARWLGNDPASYATIYRMLAHMDLRPELGRIACPVLVIGGSLDRVRPPALVEPVAQLISGARYQLLETTHYMATATPELVAGAIDSFLAGLGR
jgi:3-oxoadipate enol-lactonase